MRRDKSGGKGGGFFHMFDWSRKSRRKLFSSGASSQDGSWNHTKKRSSDNLPVSLRVDEDEIVRPRSFKGSSDCSFSSSASDEDLGATRVPGVVARLMGLDSLPTYEASDPFSISSVESRRVCDVSFKKNDQFSDALKRSGKLSKKQTELMSQKIPTSPIERFQRETLPTRTARLMTIDHSKFLSPIKNPGFMSPRNAADILEAAAKIKDSQISMNLRTPVFGSSAINATLPKQPSKIPIEANDFLRKPLQNGHNSMDYGSFSSAPGNKDENNPVSTRKGKSVSSIHKRVGRTISNSGMNNYANHKDFKVNLDRPFKSQKSNLQRKAPIANNSRVLRQDNQRQIFVSNKERFQVKQVSANGRNSISPCTRSTSGSKPYRQDCLPYDGDFLEKEERSSSNGVIPRKKRMVEKHLHEKSGVFVDTVSREKHVRPNIVIDRRSKYKENPGKNGADVVSFTFTSPIQKSMSGCDSSMIRPDVSNDDNLGHLLEEKLKALKSQTNLYSTTFARAGSIDYSLATTKEESSYYYDFVRKCALKREQCGGKLHGILNSDGSTSNNNVCEVHKQAQKMDQNGIRCISDAQVADRHHPSPLSVLDFTFSNESCASSESSGSISGKKIFPSIPTFKSHSTRFKNEDRSGGSEIEFIDSASSTPLETTDGGDFDSVLQLDDCSHEREYIKEILFNAGYMFDNLSSCYVAHSGAGGLDPCLFDELEKNRSKPGFPDKENRARRKLLFCYVGEWLDLKFRYFFQSGYKTWAKGTTTMIRSNLVNEIYKEIEGRRVAVHCVVDELVDGDMSSRGGRWTDFEVGSFKIGVKMEEEILDCLMDEVVFDLVNCV